MATCTSFRGAAGGGLRPKRAGGVAGQSPNQSGAIYTHLQTLTCTYLRTPVHVPALLQAQSRIGQHACAACAVIARAAGKAATGLGIRGGRRSHPVARLALTHMHMTWYGRNQPLRALVSTNVAGNKVVPGDICLVYFL